MDPRLAFILLVAFSGVCVHSQNLDIGDDTEFKNIKSPDDVQAISDWKDQCREIAGQEALDDIEEAKNGLMTCITDEIDVNKLQHEIKVSSPRGELDLVFKKYCRKRDLVMACAENVFSKLEVCLNEKQMRDLNVTRRALDAGIDFVCHEEGDRIALFMGEKGEECVRNHSDSIKKCIEESVPDLEKGVKKPQEIQIESITLNEENCKRVNAMHNCIVVHTQKCDDPTPSNILDSLITQMLKVTPCWVSSGAPLHLLPHLLTLLTAALTAANILL